MMFLYHRLGNVLVEPFLCIHLVPEDTKILQFDRLTNWKGKDILHINLMN